MPVYFFTYFVTTYPAINNAVLVPDGFDQGADIFLLCIRIQLDVQPTVDRLSEGDLIKKRDINDIIIIAITCLVSK